MTSQATLEQLLRLRRHREKAARLSYEVATRSERQASAKLAEAKEALERRTAEGDARLRSVMETGTSYREALARIQHVRDTIISNEIEKRQLTRVKQDVVIAYRSARVEAARTRREFLDCTCSADAIERLVQEKGQRADRKADALNEEDIAEMSRPTEWGQRSHG